MTDFPCLREVRLVADEHDGDAWLCIILQFSKPLLDVLECFGLGEVEGNDGSHCSTVVCVGDGPKSFLPGGVPNLVLDTLAVNVGRLGCELNSDGGLGVHVEDIIDEAREQVGLSHPRVADHHDLEEEVELLLSGHSEFITRITNQTNIYLNDQPPSKAKIDLSRREKWINNELGKARIVGMHSEMTIDEELGLTGDGKVFDGGFQQK